MILPLFFYFFAGLLLFFATLVVVCHRTMYGVFALVMTFLSAAGLFVLAGAPFLAMILVIVYVGAIAVFFVFVAMMLGADTPNPSKSSVVFRAVSGTVILLITGSVLILLSRIEGQLMDFTDLPLQGFQNAFEGMVTLGKTLYTDDFIPFQMVGLILFTAMVGAIVLTFRKRDDINRQDILGQLRRSPDLRMVHVPVASSQTQAPSANPSPEGGPHA